MAENIFADDWMDCLEAHYTHVIRTQDKVTEPSLTIVMHSAGFSDAQLAELRVRATMHVDDVGNDFVPDLAVLETHDHSHDVPEPAEAHVFNIPMDVPPEVEALPDTSETMEATDAVAEQPESDLEPDEPEEAEAPATPDVDAPQQLSLF